MGSFNLQIRFETERRLSIALESGFHYDDPEGAVLEAWLFTSFAARQMANIRGQRAPDSLAYALGGLRELNVGDLSGANYPALIRKLLVTLGDVKVSDATVRGTKGFTAEFHLAQRGTFKMKAHGFGMFGGGVEVFGKTATLALLWWLCNRRAFNDEYQLLMANAGRRVGYAGESAINVRSQHECAWMTWSGAVEDTEQTWTALMSQPEA